MHQTYFAPLSPYLGDHGRGDFDLQKIDGQNNLADLFTKALKIKKFNDHKSKMDIRYYTDWL